jgi:hypothetical protein
MRYDPRLRIYLVADNLSAHKTTATRESAEKGGTGRLSGAWKQAFRWCVSRSTK